MPEQMHDHGRGFRPVGEAPGQRRYDQTRSDQRPADGVVNVASDWTKPVEEPPAKQRSRAKRAE